MRHGHLRLSQKIALLSVLCVGAVTHGTIFAQQPHPPPLLITTFQLELVKQGRDFCERLAAQLITDLGEKLAKVEEELKVLQEAHPETKTEKPKEAQ